ncbi:MAG TPA: NAAT family transporter [Candidatus Bathyarchaeota archaeon]|mgnify:CR=1 FL=1|nr:MAG: MarC family protein [Candidatus Bathyarchaeota archaeon]HDI07558.1 NAAT family transporter [Candidatus Bathyarchaeota archaeon]
MGLGEFALLAITSVIAVMNPTSTVAIYLALTREVNPKERRRIAAKSMKISFLVLAFFAFTGQLVFLIFHITFAAFKIAGGILLVTSAFRMLHPKQEQYSPEELEDIATIPLAFPLTAGPGTITTVILLVSEANNLLEASLVFVAISAGIAVSYIGMIYAPKIFRFLHQEGLRVVTKLMSIIVLAIAVQFIITGITETIPQILNT